MVSKRSDKPGRVVDVVGVAKGPRVQAKNGRTVYAWVMLHLSCGHDMNRPEGCGLETRQPRKVRCEACPPLVVVK